MERKELSTLLAWKLKKGYKPLIINGASQVGKTWLLKEFGKRHFDNVAYINLESNLALKTVLSGGFDLNRILTAIQIETNFKVVPGYTLLILDEIQAMPEALTALKYFHEQLPDLHIACAGSLLGIALSKKFSFPVGKVEFMDLFPLDFMEYLDAVGEGSISQLIRSQDWLLVKAFSQKIKDLLRQYYFIGGMPEVLASFVVDKDFAKAREIQQNILRSYELDFSKHAPAGIVPRIRMLWQAIPSQLAKENKKFIYKALKPGARSRDYELALHWLIDSGLIYKINNLSAIQVPLKFYEDRDSFKLYILDVGLLGALANIEIQSILQDHRVLQEYKGAMTEQYVLQQLISLQKSELYYWSPGRSQTEIDFVIEYKSKAWPVEVKSEENLHAKSLRVFYDKYHPITSFRTSMSDFRKESWLTNIPLFGIHQIYNLVEEL